jgi:hypothetical protein
MIGRSIGEQALSALKARGHDISEADPWTVGRLTAARRDADGLLRAAATPRLMRAYAVGGDDTAVSQRVTTSRISGLFGRASLRAFF